jgi:cell division inhibitor SulA/protein ImuA
VKSTVAQLVQLPGVWRGGELEHVAHPVAPTGFARLDAELPGGGWPMATLTEVLHDGTGIGEVRFLAGALARAAGEERLVAWINPPFLPYAPALAQAGLALDRCLVVRPANREDALWAAEQALKSGVCGAALVWLESLKGHGDEYAWMRRLQLAAQSGNAMAVLYRSTAAERHSTPAHLRVALAKEAGALKVRIPKRRGPPLDSPMLIRLPGALCAAGKVASPCSGSPSNSQPSRSSSSNALALVASRS